MLKDKKTLLLILSLLLFLFLGASFICAQKPLEVVYPQIPGALTPTTTKTALPDYIRYIFQLSLFISALLAFGSLIYGGVRFLTSDGSPSVQKDAQSQISAGILGLIILISAYIILNTINPQLVGWQVSLPGKAPTAPIAVRVPRAKPASYIEIPLGGLIENLWEKRTDCYDFAPDTGDRGDLLVNHDRLDCIKELSGAIAVKAQKLSEPPVEELQKLYNCQNCCRDCCKNACQSWVVCENVCQKEGVLLWWHWENCGTHTCCEGTQKKGCWESCQVYPCCEGQGTERQYYYQECPYNCCEFFSTCQCKKCEGCICVRPDGQCCNPADPTKPYEDPLVIGLISSVKQTLKELRLKLGLFPLTEELKKNKRICCPGDTCPPDSEMGAIDCLLSNTGTKDLIKKLLVGEPVEEKKLEEILKAESVMEYLVEGDLLSADKNLAKTMLRNLDLLKNEVAINEIAWIGTTAEPNQEWIELYNNTKENINLSNWKLIVKNKFEINPEGTIPAQGFYLLKNNEEVVSDIGADLIYAGNLSDSGEKLELYDEFGNLVEEVDCSSGWFAEEETGKTSMERINSQEDGSERENWATNLSNGTPKNPNSVGEEIISYPPFGSLVAEMRNKLGKEETLREKLILVLRQDENLARMLKSKEALKNILVGDDSRLKNLLSQRDVLRILIEDKDNLTSLIEDEHAKEVIKEILVRTGDWKTGDDEEAEWAKLLADADECRTNLKLINDFQRDLLWVSNARDLMEGCIEDPISYDQLRIPELSLIKIERVPEWKDINTEVKITDPETGQKTKGPDTTIFYCHKPTW